MAVNPMLQSLAKPLKTGLIVAGGLIALFATGALVLPVLVDTDIYRSRMESEASNALGLEVRIIGSSTIDLWAGLHVNLENVQLVRQGAEVANVERARLGIDLLPLLQSRIRVGTLALIHPEISIERDKHVVFNYGYPRPDIDSESAFGWPRVSVTGGTLIFSDQQSGTGFEASNCNLKGSNLLENLSFTAELSCDAIRSHDLTLSDVNISASGTKGVIDLGPATMQVFGAVGSGSLHADFSGAVPLYELHYELPAFRIEVFFKILSPQQVAAGTLDFSADLSTNGNTSSKIRQALEGKASLRGENIKFLGRDLDQEFSEFEFSQNFNLVDVGGFFFAGPLGLLVTKGYDFFGNLKGPGGSSEIRTLVSDWQVENGIARAQDVALATGKHRVALQGGLDLVNAKFKNLNLALIDAEGCAKVSQSILGSFSAPEVETPSFIKTLAGPVVKVYEMGRDLFPGGECEPFYTDLVNPPN